LSRAKVSSHTGKRSNTGPIRASAICSRASVYTFFSSPWASVTIMFPLVYP